MGIRAILGVFSICLAGASVSATTLWGNDQQDDFTERVRKQGLSAFAGEWKLLAAEGEACAAGETVTLTTPTDLSFTAAPAGVPVPAFTVTSINGGSHVLSTWSATTRSEALWDGPMIRQREISRGYISVSRADREIVLGADGSMSIAISETAPRTNRSYRCVYGRPAASAAN